MADDCRHCEHALTDHKGQRPVFDQIMVFACTCGCRIDGTVQRVA